MSELKWQWRWSMRSTPEKLWPLVADTDRFNRMTGLSPVDFRLVPIEKHGVQRQAQLRMPGLTLAWDEFPFQFEAPHRFSVLRRYHGGPFVELEAGAELEARPGGGSRLTYSVRLVPRNFLGRLVALIQVGWLTRKKFEKVFRQYDELASAAAPVFVEPPELGEGWRQKIAKPLEGLSGAEKLLSHLVSAPASELVGMRPFELARRWGMSREEALALFLRATRRGVLDCSWTVICPGCRGDKASTDKLKDLRFEQHCDSCNLGFTADFTRLTELRFRLSRSLKDVQVPTYCVGGPMLSPHVRAQLRVGARGTTTRKLELPPGTYQLVSPLTKVGRVIEVAEGGSPALEFALDSKDAHDVARVAPSFELCARNALSHEAAVRIERTAWIEDACTADLVTALQEFRDLFASDVLAPGLAVEVANVAILFTDLKDSTAMYSRTGDAKAFGLVRDHFDVLTEVIREYRGAFVKNIGDAVMAVFVNPRDAYDAAQVMHARVSGLRTPDGGPVVLKIGLHAGPCFAVTFNDTLDYFGTTVNLAARIQGQSVGCDVVLESQLAEKLGIAQGEKFAVDLKGIEGRRELLRVPASSASEESLGKAA